MSELGVGGDSGRWWRGATEGSLLPMAALEGEAHAVVHANAAFCRLAGHALDEIVGRPFAGIVPDEARTSVETVLDRVHRTGEPEALTIQGHGTAAGWSCSAWAVLDPDERPACVMILVTDTSGAARMQESLEKSNQELRAISQQLLLSSIRNDELAELAAVAEQKLVQSKKMEGIGRLAGGIAHDFNNLLTAILGYTDIAKLTLAPDGAGQPCLDGIREAAERAGALTSQLLAFARKQIVDPKVASLNALVADIDGMLRRLLGDGVDLVFSPAEGLGHVRMDPGQFGQVLVNLVVNARDAMPGGGTIGIETSNVALDEHDARRHGDVAPGDYVVLTVRDAGVGMTEDTQAHLFEPFFTTKARGKGTGLGLATSYGIVMQSGGHIQVSSALGRGTTFEIYLPRVEEAITARACAQPGAVPKGTEVIFLVEDEPMVRDIVAQVLRRQGYTVLQAADGREALDLIRAHPQEIDLLVTDVVMPLMGGKELVDRLHETHPHLRVLYFSGHTDDAIVDRGVLHPGLAFLQKPFSPAALARKVREILEGAERESVVVSRVAKSSRQE